MIESQRILQGTLNDQSWLWTLWRSALVSLESIDVFLMLRMQKYGRYSQFPLWGIVAPAPCQIKDSQMSVR